MELNSLNRFLGCLCRLLRCLVEHLNAEVVLLTVTDVSLAIDWLKNSYLYVRVKKVRKQSDSIIY